MRLEYASVSDTGRIRTNNEDAFGVFVPSEVDELEARGALFIVADGMGGHRGGEIASKLAVDVIQEAYFRATDPDRGAALLDAFSTANASIVAESTADSSLFGMGTTCTAMALFDGKIYIGHIGDSRGYQLHGGTLTQLTNDHSLVGEMVRSGIITDEDARTHPKRNVITRSLGIHEIASPEAGQSPMALEVGDVYLICSDGLTSYVQDDDLTEILSEKAPQEACDALVDMANQSGGRDNITVQVILVSEV